MTSKKSVNEIIMKKMPETGFIKKQRNRRHGFAQETADDANRELPRERTREN